MTTFQIDGVPISYPYMTMAPEQLDYIRSLLTILKAKDEGDLDENGAHGILEMPAFAGKTLCLLSTCISYLNFTKSDVKIVYSTRTNLERGKVMDELKHIFKALSKHKDIDISQLLALEIDSREKMCGHEASSALNAEADGSVKDIRRCVLYQQS